MPKFNSPLEAFLHWEKNTPDTVFLKQPVDGKSTVYTYRTAGEEIRKIASALQHYQLPEKSHVALLSKNCAHWLMADLAIMMAGYVSIPIYPTLNANTINNILTHSEAKAIIIGKLDDFEAQQPGIPDIPMISVKLYGQHKGASWESIVKTLKPITDIQLPDKDDLISIIYTSGTSGTPKGVMHTVGNFTNSVFTLTNLFDIPKHPKFFSYLPLAHIAERVGIGIHAMIAGGTVSFAESLDTFAKDLENTQPDLFFAVPRIWAKFKEKILESIPQKKLNFLLKIPLLSSYVKKKLKFKLGLQKTVFICSGAAPLSSSLIDWFEKIDIIIHQGYGMTEDCAVSHFNLIGQNKIGTVGKALPPVKAKLAPNGEICLKNNCLMTGYFNAPELTQEAFDTKGYLKTGDLGEYDHDGYLTITGRVKDQFKTDKGKYISPSPIELNLSKNTAIEQVCIVGTGIPQPIALITLSVSGKALSKKDLIAGLLATMDTINNSLEKHEKLEKVIIMREDWTVDNGLTTPTLKVKRNAIEKIHQPMYQQWFQSTDKILFE